MPQTPAPRPSAAPPVLASVEEADGFLRRLGRTMAELAAVLAEETRLVRAARMKAAAPLEARKTELALAYRADLAILKANAVVLRRASGPALARLGQENEALQQVLELNLATLATAHAVAEGIVRSVSASLQAARAPATYGADGRTHAPPPRAGAPVAVLRSL